MRNKKKIKGSFFSLLLRNYIIFTGLLIFLIFSILVGILFGIVRIVGEEILASPLEYNDILSEGKYEEIPISKIAGEKGCFIVINEKYEIIYRSNSNIEIINLTKDELEYIPSYDEDFTVSISDFNNSKDEQQISLIIQGINDNGQEIDERYILDKDFNIIYQSVDRGKTKFTKNEFGLITNTLYEDYIIEKYSFIDKEGKEYIAIIYKTEKFNSYIDRFKKLLSNSGKVFTIFYCILIGVFMLWLQRKVKKPLRMLQEALMEFSKGERQQYLDYKGPSEFVEICETFNEMSQKLCKSEDKRIKAENDKKKMLADISHDLKTPITVIQGYAKAISDGIVPEDEKLQYILAISQKADLLNELINTFHQYSKMDHPDYTLSLEPYDIFIFIRDYIAEKYNEFELEGFDLDIQIPEKHMLCYMDKVQLKRAFDNIVSNAIKHNKRGTTIFCAIKNIDDKVMISFGDNGVGIPEEVKNDIFEPFIVGEKSRNKYSSGLGLAISKKIIEAHNGAISLLSDEVAVYKTEFEIILPVKQW